MPTLNKEMIVLRAMSTPSMLWQADIVALRSRGSSSRCRIWYLESSEASGAKRKFLGYARLDFLLWDISRLVYGVQECRVEGLVQAVVKSDEISIRQVDVDFLSICWCYDHVADGIQPFILTFFPEIIDVVVNRYGSLLSVDFIKFAAKILDAFKPDHSASFDKSPLASFGSPGSLNWLLAIESAADHLLGERSSRSVNLLKLQKEQISVERENALIDKECVNVQKLVAKYGFRIPPTHLVRLLMVARPEAGRLSNAILLSWMFSKDKIEATIYKDNLYWPVSLRFLKWIFSDQQAKVWGSLESHSVDGRIAAQYIREIIHDAVDKLSIQIKRAGGSANASAIPSGIRKSWLALLN